jgi:hypothetical protein
MTRKHGPAVDLNQVKIGTKYAVEKGINLELRIRLKTAIAPEEEEIGGKNRKKKLIKELNVFVGKISDKILIEKENMIQMSFSV